MVSFRWPWTKSQQTFAAPQWPGYYSMAMALDSGLIDGAGVTREAALGVPAVLKGRNMICNVSTLPLVVLDPARKPVRDSLFEQIDPQVANVVTLAMTVEDLLMDGVAWWEITERGWNNYPSHARHVDSRRVTINPPPEYVNALPSGFDPRSTIYVDGKPKDALGYIRFDSPNPPLLIAARRAINRAVLLEDTTAMYADNPRPGDFFTPGEGVEGLSREKVMETLAGWKAARKQRTTAYVPETLKYNSVQAPNPVELQLAQMKTDAKLDIANAIGVDPEDLGISTTSRTYQNDVSRNQNKVNEVLSGYIRAVTDRLSMPDVTRRGYRASFLLNDYLRADPETRWGIHEKALAMGATDIAEIRQDEDWAERPDLNKPKPEPAPVVVEQPVIEAPVEPMTAENARGGTMQTFSDTSKSVTLRLDSDATTFAVDTARRVIKGRIALYNTPANNGEGTFTFAPGSVEWNRKAINRVKFLRDHDWAESIGAALAIREASDGSGLDGEFKVARGPKGDQALNDAEDWAADGLSIGVDIHEWEETGPNEFYVTRSTLNETSLTPRPAFDDARLTSVAASNTKGKNMPEDKTPDAPVIDYDKLAVALAKAQAPKEPTEDEKAKAAELAKKDAEKPGVVNPAARELPGETFARASVQEKSPYTFDRQGRFAKGEYEFSTDFGAMLRDQDFEGKRTEAGKRVMGHIAQNFVASTDINELTPAIQTGQYYNPPANRTPLWNMVNKGSVPNGVQPFVLPKFSSASGLVADHTEGTEPDSGTFVTTSQTITPTPLSGKVSVTREVIDMGGNPAVSNLIWQRMLRSWDEGLETATATFLATLTAATDIVLPGGAIASPDAALAAAIQSAIIDLNFTAGYDWDAFAVEKILYKALANMVDGDGRPLYPALGATNANGTAGNLFQRLNVNGLVAVPAGGLASTANALNSSWLFDSSVVHGYASTPQRLSFAGTDAAGGYAPVAMVDIAIWGYKAFANTDIAGVRQVTYDEDLAV